MRKEQSPLLMLAIMSILAQILIGCGTHPKATETDNRWRALTEEIQKRNIDEDLRQAIAKDDFRFKGIYLDGLYLPGVPSPIDYEVEQNFGVDPNGNTSDAISPGAQEEYQNAAEKYAEQYNQKLLQYLKQHGKIRQ